MTHKTKGIVLKYIFYGDTSLIVTVYTELFGIQKYIVKGVRKNTKTGNNRISFFQPGAILDMEVYKNDFKQLQFIREYKWGYRYENLYFDVIKNAIATYMVELFLNAVNETEDNEELFYLLENYLINTDKSGNKYSANVPLFFSLALAKLIGFQINKTFTSEEHILDLYAGEFTDVIPSHSYYIEGNTAEITAYINNNLQDAFTGNLLINRKIRQELLNSYQIYFTLHIENFTRLKSLPILQTVI